MIDPTERSFIDASVFLLDVFDDEKYGEYCHRLIIKIENNVIQGITSIMVLDEVLFKMLIMEASNKFDINIGGASRYLKENPDKIPTLEKSWENIDKISSIPNLIIVGISIDNFKESLNIAREYNQLPHDALHLAVMKDQNITLLQTADSDFDGVEWITVKKPVKIPSK